MRAVIDYRAGADYYSGGGNGRAHRDGRAGADIERRRRDRAFAVKGERARARDIDRRVSRILADRICRVAGDIDDEFALFRRLGDFDYLDGGDAGTNTTRQAVADDGESSVGIDNGGRHNVVAALSPSGRGRCTPAVGRSSFAFDEFAVFAVPLVIRAVDGHIAERDIGIVVGEIDYSIIAVVGDAGDDDLRGRIGGGVVDIALAKVGRGGNAAASPVSTRAGNRDAHSGDGGRRARRVDLRHGRKRSVVADKVVPRGAGDGVVYVADVGGGG